MTLDDDERVGRGRAGGALGALAPAPAPSAHDVVAVHEDDLARVGEDAAGRSQVGEELVASGETNSDAAIDIGLVKHGNGQGVADRDEIVDIGNLVSIRHALPVAVFDLANIDGCITVRFATGDELFTDLGSTGSIFPDPGEVIFVDSNNVVSARRWCWRQSAQSATSATTADALVVIEGHHDTAGQDVEAALTDLTSLLASHQPHSQTRSYVLSPTNPCTGASEGLENPSR